jgi:predicted Zn-dependent protease
MKFWLDRLSKNAEDETSLVKLAGLHSERFKTTGFVADLITSDSLYKKVLGYYPHGNVDIYHALAANSITQHQFRRASDYVQKAYDLKDKKSASLFIMVDVALELGDLARAKRILAQITNKNAFAYLIRAAKVKDHEGHLDSAILLMEKAYARVKSSQGSSLWTLSNLGDMYGHAGRIDDAYRAYLEVLQRNPQDGYSLKGIAWIALSHDHNVKESRRIVEVLASRKRMPEAYLMLAEIAALEGNKVQKATYLKQFVAMATEAGYATMYNKYLANLAANEFNNPQQCIAIANEEIKNRPTPQSYDLLAWGLFKQNKLAKALEIAEKYVVDQTYEPDAMYHLGMIYWNSGDQQRAQDYLDAAHDSSFELGPAIAADIQKALDNL